MGKKVTLDNFDNEIKKILDAYGDNVSENLDVITRQVGQKGAQMLRNESRSAFNRTGKYASGWTSKTERNRLYTSVIIYNRTPGLPHLLEHGHAKRGGGRTRAISHIAPAEEKGARQLEEDIKRSIRNG